MVTDVLVDTSVWIEFFNRTTSPHADKLAELIESKANVWVTPTIIQELLQGFQNDEDFEAAKEIMLSYPIMVADPVEASVGAAELYRLARKRGLTVRRSNDCLIAWYAVQAGFPILHKDRDFELLSQIVDLGTLSV